LSTSTDTVPPDDPVQAAIAGELRLLDPEVRASAALLDQLLAPEFSEIGASGRVWDRASIIAALTSTAGHPPAPIEVAEITGALVAPGLVQVRFTTVSDGRRAHRSSLWRLSERGWRLVFHQATPAP
jgi:hypothetical protein